MRALGVDPALGGGHAQVCADLGEKLTIIDARTDYDLSKTEEQLSLIENMVTLYRPSVVIVETDALLKGFANDDRLKAMGDRYGFRVQPHKTQYQKMDEVFGVARMDQSFKRGEIRIPYKDLRTQDRMAPLLAQLRAWRPDVKTKMLTQDLVMALWFVWLYWVRIRKQHEENVTPAWRPSWVGSEAGLRGAALSA